MTGCERVSALTLALTPPQPELTLAMLALTLILILTLALASLAPLISNPTLEAARPPGFNPS